MPMDLIVASPSQEPVSKAFMVSKSEQERTQRNQRWAETRDQWIAFAAAAVHIAAFAYNLAFWGSEGMPSDRYWPADPRCVAGLRGLRHVCAWEGRTLTLTLTAVRLADLRG